MSRADTTGAQRPGRRIEGFAAAIVLAPVFLYFATDLSVDPDVWRFSYADLAQVLVAGAVTSAYLLSYRFRLPAWLATGRSVVTVSLATLLVAGLLGEVVLRAVDRPVYEPLPNVGRHAYDEDVGHVYHADYTQVLQTREWRQEWRSNAQGVRANRDFGPKSPGVVRILVLGDSFTVGDQVAIGSTYPGVIQRLLDEAYGPGRFEVVNAGFPGYGTVHEAGYLKKYGARFEPDLVLLGMTPNDLVENRAPRAVIAHEGALVRRGAMSRLPVVEDRQRWYNVRGAYERSNVVASLRNIRLASAPYTHRRAFMIEPDSVSNEQYRIATQHLLEARDHARELGATFAFFTIPFLAQLVGLEDGLDPTAYGRRWSEVAAAEGLPFVDVYPAFASHPEPTSLYWVEDAHCTEAGYELIGRTVFDMLTRHATELGLEEGG